MCIPFHNLFKSIIQKNNNHSLVLVSQMRWLSALFFVTSFKINQNKHYKTECINLWCPQSFCIEDSPSSCQAPGSCGPSWSSAVAWAPLHWRSASCCQSSAGQKSWTWCPKYPCQTGRPHRARYRWASAEVDRRTRRRSRVTHRNRSYSSDSLKIKRKKNSVCYMLFTQLCLSWNS